MRTDGRPCGAECLCPCHLGPLGVWLALSLLLLLGITAPAAASCNIPTGTILTSANCNGIVCAGASVSMNADLVCTNANGKAGSGIQLESNVSLNCGGHAIIGSPQDTASPPQDRYGIRVDGRDTGLIYQCNVSGWTRGVYITDSRKWRVIVGTADGNGRADHGGGSAGYMLTGADSYGNEFAFVNGINGTDEGIHISDVQDQFIDFPNVIRSSSFQGNYKEGLYLIDTVGTQVLDTFVGGNNTSNTSSGIYVKNTKNCLLQNVMASGNSLELSGSTESCVFSPVTVKGARLRFTDNNTPATHPVANFFPSLCVTQPATITDDTAAKTALAVNTVANWCPQ